MDQSQPRMSIVVFTALIAIILQLVVAPAITLFGVVPNFIMVAAIITALRNGPVRSTVTGFLLGLFFDLCSLGPMGAMTLVLTILSYAVSSLNRGGFAGNIIIDLFTMIAAVALGEFLVSVIYAIAGANPQFMLSLVQLVLPAIVYDSVIGCILLIVFNEAQRGRKRRSGPTLGSGRSLSRKLNKL
ncbi:MAG: rod shape-determining protein MreD [Coriobacteriia bacterium]|nr:rod shape-determining protein MreD [Coriobacteriia bacterium]MCL2750157.1 rod shape-determining protein MreD [Coriobacteriia bacterium]